VEPHIVEYSEEVISIGQNERGEPQSRGGDRQFAIGCWQLPGGHRSMRPHLPGPGGGARTRDAHLGEVRRSVRRDLNLWLYSEENLPAKHRQRFEALRDSQLNTGRAWAIKESLRALWHYRSGTWGRKFWRQWYFWAMHSQLTPIIDAARTVHRHIDGILNYFDHRMTNAASEGMNSRIQRIRQMACGHCNRRNFKTAIYFHLGGLDLYPATH
jgi:transposase